MVQYVEVESEVNPVEHSSHCVESLGWSNVSVSTSIWFLIELFGQETHDWPLAPRMKPAGQAQEDGASQMAGGLHIQLSLSSVESLRPLHVSQ